MNPFFCESRCYAPVTDSAPGATSAKSPAPFYANQPCRVCARPMAAEGVFITDDQKWCRPCARTLRDLLNSTLPREPVTPEGWHIGGGFAEWMHGVGHGALDLEGTL